MHSSGVKIRVVHNVANGPDVDVFVNDNAVEKNVPYKKVTSYLITKHGNIKIKVNVSNTDKTVAFGHFNGMESTHYTLIISGNIKDLSSIVIHMNKDSNECSYASTSKLRFIHSAATVPAVDLYGNNKILSKNINYGESGNPEFYILNSGNNSLSVKAHGSNVTALGPLTVSLRDGGVYTIIATGIISDKNSPLSAIVIDDTDSCIEMLSGM